MWALTVFFFAYQFVLRVSPGIFMQEISSQFNINATAFGILSAAYYIGYSGMQLPMGVLLDKYGPRFVVPFCIMICVIGNLSFIYTNNWTLALIGRFLIGAGSAAGFLGASKVVFSYFKPQYFSYMIGITFTVGLVGAVCGGRPVRALSESYGWDTVLLIQSAIGVIVALMIAIFAKNHESEQSKDWGEVFSGVIAVIKTPRIVMLALCGALLVGPLEAFADVWGVQYLVKTFAMDKIAASTITTMIYFGMCFGGLIIGYLADKFRNQYYLTAACGITMAAIFFIIMGGSSFTPLTLMVLMFIVGIACCYQIIIFTIVSQIVPSSLTGIATSFTNMINMLAGTAFHLVIGWVMDMFWLGKVDGAGLRIYDQSAYHYSVMVIPITLIIGIIGMLAISSSKRPKAVALGLI
jgi:MFS family permease